MLLSDRCDLEWGLSSRLVSLAVGCAAVHVCGTCRTSVSCRSIVRAESSVTPSNLTASWNSTLPAMCLAVQYTLWVNKKQATINLPITSRIVDWFSKLLNWQIHEEICNKIRHILIVLLHYLVRYQCSKIAVLKTWVYEASCHAKLSHLKQLLKIPYSDFSII